VIALTVAGCGGKVAFDPRADASTSLPVPPSACADAIGAIDWSACDAMAKGPNPRDAPTIYCAQVIGYPGCNSETAAYYSCLARQRPACQVYDAGAGTIGEKVAPPACESVRATWETCLATCSGGFSCADQAWTGCTCSPAAPHAGASCAVYPAMATPSPDCNALCFQCGK